MVRIVHRDGKMKGDNTEHAEPGEVGGFGDTPPPRLKHQPGLGCWWERASHAQEGQGSASVQ